jgi:hypothetical protein
VTALATLGDLLASARRRLHKAMVPGDIAAPGLDVEEVTASLLHLVTVLARYVGDITPPLAEPPGPQLTAFGTWARATVEVQDSLASAATWLGHTGTGIRPPGGRPRSDLARRLDLAATSLTAGRDLLQAHFTTTPDRAQLPHSSWAIVITSPPVTRALLTEITTLAEQASLLTVGAALPRDNCSRSVDDARLRLRTACQWLQIAAATVRAADQRESVTVAEQDLLYAIPANALPPRQIPDGTEPVPALYDAVITAAQRARHAAWAAAGQPPWSAAISVTSWRRIAAASMVTSHHCHLILTTLADRTEGHDPQLSARLVHAAATARLAGARWQHAAREFQDVTTETRGHQSPAAEAADLALWTGRLAYASPDWTLTSGPGQPPRPPASLAPRPSDVPRVVAAMHHASDTLTRLATANLEQARAASSARRILKPTRWVPERSPAPRTFAPVKKDRATTLLMACQDTRTAAADTASAVADIAAAVRAPSQILTTATAATRDRAGSSHRPSPRTPEQTPAGPAHDPGPVETRLRDLDITSPRHLWRAAAIDRAGQQLITDAIAERQHERIPPAVAAGPPAIAVPGSHALAARQARATAFPRTTTGQHKQPEAEAEP